MFSYPASVSYHVLEPTFLQLGDAADLGPNASVMLRISTLAAWAELKIASRTHAYLSEVLQVHASTLAPLWISCLRDYASIKVGVEGLDDVTAASLDTSYGGLGREVLLPVCVSLYKRDARN